ncbi:MAG: extracellular solute-binding protein [Oscillospiraceae bacterium]|nr:extracellular solute-binding protein [Oscillospiraceae bacterium]
MKRLLALFLALILGLPVITGPVSGAAEDPGNPFVFQRGEAYSALGPVDARHIPEAAITVSADAYIEAEGVLPFEDGGIAVRGGFVTYTVDIPRDGRYCLLLTYQALAGGFSDIEYAVYINGELPFSEAGVSLLRRSWRYADTERRVDNRGNMLRPSSEEVLFWNSAYCEDKEGLYTEPFAFFFPEGTHELTLRAIREPFALQSLSLTPPPSVPSYAEVSAGYDLRDVAKARPVTVLATDAHLRSDPALMPVSDRSNPFLEPFSLTSIAYNVFGGDIWCRPGQAASWILDIPEDGLYAISFVYKQDAVVGLPVTRSLRIDGETPFSEMNALVFPYSSAWERMTVQAGGGDALFYLTEGRRELSLTVTLGDTGDVCRRVSDLATELNDIYTRIVMITGSNPDPMRDYRIDERLPGILGEFAVIARRLDGIAEEIRALGGGRNDALTISIIASQLHDFVEKPDSIPGRLMRFKDNIVNLTIWVLISSEMPLALYSVSAGAPDAEFGPVRPGFFASIWFSVRRFFASFTALADMAGNVYDESEGRVINVWGAYGKDFAELIKRLCDEVFTPQTGIMVNFSVLNRNEAMFFSIASGTGPDVCLNVFRPFPVDFGLRGTATDLSALPGYAEFEKLFAPTAAVPLSFRGQTFGFPMTLMFPVMYVRTDIFDDLGLDIPQTWDDFYQIIGALGERNLQVSPSGELLPLFVQQNGGRYFNEDLTQSLLDDPVGIAALTEWTNLFTLHGAPVQSDFFNRFRTGEMPIGIADNSLYTNFHYAALEIKDKWAMLPVPGVRLEDGTIDRTIVSGAGNGFDQVASTAGFITNTRPERLDDAWIFVQWLMSLETQTRICRDIESMFGVIGRYYTATVETHNYIAWNKDAYDTLMASIGNLREIPSVPGAYFLGRHINNAFNEIVLRGEPPRSAMIKYNEIINREIAWKYEELGLN